MVEMSFDLYTKRLLWVLAVGVVMGVILSILFSAGYNSMRAKRISEVGVNLLFEDDGIIKVPKGTLIQGNAHEVVYVGNSSVDNQIKTPFVTKKSMLIQCNKGETSVCVVYPSNSEYGDYSIQKTIDKIFLK